MSDIPAPPPDPGIRYRPKIWIHAGLFVATFVTATMAGSWAWEGTFDLESTWRELVDLSRLSHGLTYATLLLLILGAHEMGHYLACRYYDVPATPPFFIPGPPMLIGTLGAVIRIRGAIPSRRALFDIAAAGPIAGFLVAVPFLILGVASATEIPAARELPAVTLGPPLLSTILERWLHGEADLAVGSVYGAAWVGMLVTSMNLFPVGQLDGGHALYALSPKAHRIGSWITIGVLAGFVAVESARSGAPSAYTVWLFILLWLRDRHPRLLEQTEPLGRGRVAVLCALAAIFVLSFIAVPLDLD